MAYYPDLSPYVYRDAPAQPPWLNVGWLDGEHEFEKRAPEDELVQALWEHCIVLVSPLRGFHSCELCRRLRQSPLPVTRAGVTRKLGFAEIRVFDAARDVVYAAPNLVFHYVTSHRYDPPAVFKEAALRLRPPSPDYMVRLRALGVRYWDERSINDRPRPSPPS